MYKIRIMCFDPENPPYIDIPSDDIKYDTKEDAFEAMRKMAECEVESLNDGCVDGVSFGIYEEETNEKVTVNYYYTPNGDTTGNTETVTIYYLEKDE